jgi:hypothetical protein
VELTGMSHSTIEKGIREDDNKHHAEIKFSDKDMIKLRLKPHSLYPKWNYAMLPDSSTPNI